MINEKIIGVLNKYELLLVSGGAGCWCCDSNIEGGLVRSADKSGNIKQLFTTKVKEFDESNMIGRWINQQQSKTVGKCTGMFSGVTRSECVSKCCDEIGSLFWYFGSAQSGSCGTITMNKRYE